MDQSDNFEDDTTLKEIEKAQKTLEDVESKMKRFKSRRRQKSQSTITKAPFPDLNKYFSYLTNEFHNQQENDELLIQNDTRSRNPSYHHIQSYNNNATKTRFQEKQNYAISINQKVEKEKNSSIHKIQEFYIQRNQILEEKINEMKMIKEKIVKDQKLLLRNNRELEEELAKVRQINSRQESEKIISLRQKIDKIKQKINSVQTQNNKALARKKDLQKHVKQVLKAHRQTLSYQGLIRPKSSSVKRCQYH